MIEHIVSRQPAERHFTGYDSLTRVKRIAKLTAANPESQVVKGLFCSGWLDDALLKLPSDLVSENAEAFAHLYDAGYPDLKTALENFSCEGSDKALKALSDAH